MLAVLGAAAKLSPADLARAYLPKPLPTSHVVGADGTEIFKNMNEFLLKQAHSTQACEEWTHDELNDVARTLWKNRDEKLASIYDGADDNRKFHFNGLSYKEILWAQEAKMAKSHPETHGKGSLHYDIARDGKCAEVVMWWIHHLPQQSRSKLAKVQGFKVPLLPANGLRIDEAEEHDSNEYVYQVTCGSCHSNGTLGDSSSSSGPVLRSKESVDDVPYGTCPINQKTGKPTVWYEPMSDKGNRKKRCDWDYDPPCEPCEGIGGYSWGDQENQIRYTSCTKVMDAADIPKDNITNPVWPEAFQVNEVTVLINQLSEGGQFPGANPCDIHNFNNDTEVFYYDSDPYPIMYTKTSKTSIWTLPTADMFIKIEGLFCICVTPLENGDKQATPTGPLFHDFAKDAVLIGREKIGLEKVGTTVLADHWSKGPHHFWIDVNTNLMVRGWQPWNGLNVYVPGTWKIGKPAAKVFEVDGSCYKGLLHQNISCVALSLIHI